MPPLSPAPPHLSGPRAGRWRLLAAVVLVTGLLAVGWWNRPTPDQLRSLHAQAGRYSAPLFVAAGVLLIAAFVPKTVVSISAGAIFGTVSGSLLMVLVATLAAAFSYCLARWLLRERLESWAAARPHWDAVRRMAGEGGYRLQLLLRLAPVPTMLTSYACGAAGARVSPFLTAAAVAVASQVPWVHSGAIASTAITAHSGAARQAEWVSLGITVAASAMLALYLKRYAQQELARAGGVASGEAR